MSCKEVGVLQLTITLLSISARASDARNLSGLRANFASLAGAARSSGKEARGSSVGDLGCPWLAVPRGSRRSHCPGIRWRKEAPPAGARSVPALQRIERPPQQTPVPGTMRRTGSRGPRVPARERGGLVAVRPGAGPGSA